MFQGLHEKYGWLGLASAVFGIAGFAFGVFTWYQSRQFTEISYAVEQVQMLISSHNRDHNPNRPFKVIGSDGHEITENIFGANVTVWNSGNLPVYPGQVRRPVVIQIPSSVRVMKIALSGSSDNNISEFTIDEIERKVDWKYFDPKMGFRATIIYSSPNQEDIKIGGVIYGVNGFRDVLNDNKNSGIMKWYMITMAVLYLSIVIFLSISMIKGWVSGVLRYNARPFYMIIVSCILSAVCFFGVVFNIFNPVFYIPVF